jgi:transcriptional regulator with PAS, ATPase and Fis domain
LSVDVRVLASTNKNPEEAVAKNELRNDLFFRLNVVRITIPPLRERLEDVGEIAAALVDELNRKHNRKVAGIDDEVRAAFQEYSWPGNVRELRNVLERAVVICPENILRRRDIAPDFGRPAPLGGDSQLRLRPGMTVAEAEKLLIFETLASSQNNKTRAAKMLGISLKTLHNKLKDYETQSQD